MLSQEFIKKLQDLSYLTAYWRIYWPIDARISVRECALLEVSLMVKDSENENIPSSVGTFVIVTFDSESWIDADKDDSTLAGKGKCNSKEQN